MQFNDQIFTTVKHYPGLRAREIARRLVTDRRSVNQVLYGKINSEYYRDDNYCWYILNSDYQPTAAQCNKVVEKSPGFQKIKRVIKSVYEMVEYIENIDSDLFYPNESGSSFFDDSDELHLNVDYHIFSFAMDICTDIDDVEEWEFDLIMEELEDLLEYQNFDYINYITSYKGFCTRTKSMPAFLPGIIEYDRLYDTCFAELTVHCFDLLGKALKDYFDEELSTNSVDYMEHVKAMRNYVESRIDIGFDDYLECDDDDDEDDEDDEFEIEEEDGDELLCEEEVGDELLCEEEVGDEDDEDDGKKEIND